MSSRDKQSSHEVVRAKTDGNDVEVSGYRGTFPPPEIIRVLNENSPDATHRILVMSEREQTHDHRLELREQVWRGIFGLLGQIFGFLLGAATIGGAVWLMSKGNGLAGFGTLVSGLALLVGAFLRSDTRKR